MSNLNEEILNQIRLIRYDRSKILSEQDGLPRAVSDWFEDVGRWIEDKTMTNQEAQQWGKDNLSFLNDLDFSDPDTAIDSISILVGLVPGLGALASAIIDVLHGISYWVRIPFESDEKEQIKLFLIGLVQIILAFDPTGAYGNVLMKTIKGKIDEVIRMTPCDFLKLLGFSCINLRKGKINWWKILLIWFLKMVLNTTMDELVSIVSKVLSEFKSNVSKLCNFEFSSYIKLVFPTLNTMCTYMDEYVKVFDDESKRLNQMSSETKKYEENLKIETEYVKNKCLAYRNWLGSKNKNSVRSIQKLMKDLGHNIEVDGVFGNVTANALGTFIYGSKEGVNNTYELWLKMKKDGWDVGSKPGFGSKMSKELFVLLSKMVSNSEKNYQCSDLSF